MTVVSSKEFAAHQEKYYDLAVNGQICIRNGNNMFQLVSANMNDTEKPITEKKQQPSSRHHQAEMLGCDPANTYALKSAPVLEGDEAIEFLERVEANLKVPLQSRPSKKEREEWEELFRKHDLDKLKNGL